jgi:hypothetical protein
MQALRIPRTVPAAERKRIAARFRRRNPDRGVVEIYRYVDRVEATKGPGHALTGRFYHNYGEHGSPRPRLLGLPAGARVIDAKGRELIRLPRRACLIAGPEDTWFYQDV